MRAVVRDDREARLAVDGAVVADERSAPRDLTLGGTRHERGDDELALGEARDRAEIMRAGLLLQEGREGHETERGQGHESADDAAETERGQLEEGRAPVRGRRDGLRLGGPTAVSALRLDGRRLRQAVAAREVTNPEEAEADCDDGAGDHDRPVDDEADEQRDHAQREADRP